LYFPVPLAKHDRRLDRRRIGYGRLEAASPGLDRYDAGDVWPPVVARHGPLRVCMGSNVFRSGRWG